MSYFPMNARQSAEYHRARQAGDMNVIDEAIRVIAMTMPALLPAIGSDLDSLATQAMSPFAQQYEVVRRVHFLLCQLTELSGVDTGQYRILINSPQYTPAEFISSVLPTVMNFFTQQVDKEEVSVQEQPTVV